MVKFLRIFSFVTSFPALLFFFYFIIKSLERTGEGASGRLGIVLLAFVVLFIPVSFNRIAKVIENSGAKKNL
ncbi:MAG: hypothetical protein ACE5EZ_01885 [Thermodesulfobacteriota bacterium]